MNKVLLFLSLCILVSLNLSAQQSKISVPSQLSFIENKGQLRLSGIHQEDILYYTQSPEFNIYIAKGKIFYSFSKKNKIDRNVSDKEMPSENCSTEYYTVELALQNLNPSVSIISENRSSLVSNYFLPQCKQGISVTSYEKVIMQNVYKGIDWVLYFNNENGNRNFKYDFILHPDADAGEIKIKCSSSSSISLGRNGGLRIETPFGNINDGKPVSQYQESKLNINSSFTLSDNVIGFSLGAYDHSLTAVIDPTVLWSTYFGYNGDEHGRAIYVDDNGYIYAAGFTNSSNFPSTLGYSSPIHDAFDGWIMKLTPGFQPVWITYIGGSLADVVRCVETDSAGNVFAAMETRSSDIPTFNAYQPIKNDTDDFYILKLNPSGYPIWGSFYGGDSLDAMRRLKLSHHGYLVASGYSRSLNFPMVNPVDATNNGSADAIVMKLDMATGYLLKSTYLGGSAYDEPVGISLDQNGNIFVVGTTESNNFPLANPYQNILKGTSDIFLTKLKPDFTLDWSTYFGCTKSDDGNAIAVDSFGNCVITGTTSKNNYPTLNAWQPVFKFPSDAVISKFNSTGGLMWSTYAGGSGSEEGVAVAFDKYGNVLATGYTMSSTFPVLNPLQQNLSGTKDAFVIRLNKYGAGLISTYYGGSGSESARAIAVDKVGSVYVIGSTSSYDLYLKNPIQSANGTLADNGSDAFILKMNYAMVSKPIITVTGGNPKCYLTDSVKLTSNIPYGNLWSTGSLDSSINTNLTGTFYVTQTDSTGLGISSDNISITNNPVAYFSFDSTSKVICYGNADTLTAPFMAGVNYQWTGPVGFTSNIQNPILSDLNEVNMGVYQCVALNGNCSRVIKKINLLALANIQEPTNTTYSGEVCTGNSFTLLTDFKPGMQYNWSGPNGWTSNLQNPTITNAQSNSAGVYSLFLSSMNCQSNSQSVQVIVDTPPVSDAGQDLYVCNGTNAVTMDATNPAAGLGSWTYSGTTQLHIVSPNDPNSQITNISSATNQLKWTVSNGTCTPAQDIAIIKYTSSPNFGCIKPVNLYSVVNGNSVTLTWSNCTIADQYYVRYILGSVSKKKYTTAHGTIINNLAPGTYYWNVKPKCSGVWTSQWSVTKSFTILPPRDEDETESSSENLGSQLSIFPNPANDLISISFDVQHESNYQFKVFDLSGKEIISMNKHFEEGEWIEPLYISQLSSGMYIFCLKSEDGTFITRKFIKL